MGGLLAVVFSLRTQQRPCLGGGSAKARQWHETQPALRSAVGIYDTHCGGLLTPLPSRTPRDLSSLLQAVRVPDERRVTAGRRQRSARLVCYLRLEGLDRVLHQHRDRDRADPAGHGGNERGPLLCRRELHV